jgi:ankyrin repeat protein/serine/threonine protein kinase
MSFWKKLFSASSSPTRKDRPAPQASGDRESTTIAEPASPDLAEVGVVRDWRPGQSLLDDFLVERTLGEGGMGKVYLVRSASSGSRFAVKRATGIKETDRRNFLGELQTWIDLPEHANFAPCRFFRTIGDEVVIFAEYVAGGSLENWIQSRKLYEGGPSKTLELMLDISIQFAWGLHCLHELGLIHQDVKPANVLMGEDASTRALRPRVTDYGLVRARAASGNTSISDSRGSIPVSSGGGTHTYWSPEQANGLFLTRKTDIWSWAVSVLEMFTGNVTWMSGTAAAQVLEQYEQEEGRNSEIPVMPRRLADLLRECFRQEPQDRPATLAEVVDRLRTVYQESVGTVYSSDLAVVAQKTLPKAETKRRRADPREWLEKALRAAGSDPAEATAILAGRATSRYGELVAELAGYNDAKQIYLRLVRGGRKDLENDVASLCMEKAFVHENVGDLNGAISEYDQAIAIREQLVNQKGHWELASNLATLYLNKALAVGDLGNNWGRVALHDQAIAILERLVNREDHRELALELAIHYMNKANVVGRLGDNRGALALYDQAIAIWERPSDEVRRKAADHLARLYSNKAHAVGHLGDNRSAMVLYDQAVSIWERLVIKEGHHEFAVELALDYMSKGLAVAATDDNRNAVALQDQAITILERLVRQEGRRELADDLVNAYMHKGAAILILGDDRGAVAICDQAITLLEHLVIQEGRRKLANRLAMLYVNKAVAIERLGDGRSAVALSDQAIVIQEHLVNQDGRRELAGDLARSKAFRGKALISLRENEKGFNELRSAESILLAEVIRTDRAELKQFLKSLQEELSKFTQYVSSDLLDAADDGNAILVQSLLDNGADVNTVGALLLASQKGHLAVVHALLAKGADPNVKTDGVSPLGQACMEGHLEIALALLAKGADVNTILSRDATALILASQNGHRAVVQALLAHGANSDAKASDGATALILASKNGHNEAVSVLLGNGVEVDAKMNNGLTALMIASKNGHMAAVQALLENGAGVDKKMGNGATSLMLAVVEGHLAVVRALLDGGANVNATMNNGVTALAVALHEGHSNIVQLLQQRGCT